MNISPEQAPEKIKQELSSHFQIKGNSVQVSTHRAAESCCRVRRRPRKTLACADSRVSSEFIFDAGLGDLFVCKNAGNVVTYMVLDSIEYAALRLETLLLVVLGHKGCGAVRLTVEEIQKPGVASREKRSLITLVEPPVTFTQSDC